MTDKPQVAQPDSPMPNTFDELMAGIDPVARDAISTWCKNNTVPFVIKETDMTDQSLELKVRTASREFWRTRALEAETRIAKAREALEDFWSQNMEHPAGINAEKALARAQRILRATP